MGFGMKSEVLHFEFEHIAAVKVKHFFYNDQV